MALPEIYQTNGEINKCGKSRVISRMKTLAESGFVF
jgi:hypothetical protein